MNGQAASRFQRLARITGSTTSPHMMHFKVREEPSSVFTDSGIIEPLHFKHERSCSFFKIFSLLKMGKGMTGSFKKSSTHGFR